MTLIRIYDDHGSSLSLRNFLKTIDSYPHLFSLKSFRQRMSKNPYLESLIRSRHVPTSESIKNDLRLIDNSQPLIFSLKQWRDKAFAHHDPGIPLGKINLSDDYPLSHADTGALIVKAHEVFDKYSNAYKCESYSTQFTGHHDYSNLLSLCKLGIKTRRSLDKF